MEIVGIFYGHLEYITAIGNYVSGHTVYFLPFGTLYHEKSGSPE
jgi:hypothetical protein